MSDSDLRITERGLLLAALNVALGATVRDDLLEHYEALQKKLKQNKRFVIEPEKKRGPRSKEPTHARQDPSSTRT